MSRSTGNEPKHVGNRPVVRGATRITGKRWRGTPKMNKTTRGVAHTRMHSDTPSGKGQRRHY